jgi:chromosome partitioning protein
LFNFSVAKSTGCVSFYIYVGNNERLEYHSLEMGTSIIALLAQHSFRIEAAVFYRERCPMTEIIGIIQVKGGVGRSTIATNLAAILSAHSPTLLIDCDLPQATSASWYATRQTSLPSEALSLATAANHLELIDRIQEVADRYRYIIIDAPPRIAEMTRAIIILSHLCLIPLGASASEIWSTSDLLTTIDEAKNFKHDVDARVLWTRYRAYTKEARELSEAVDTEMNLKSLVARIGYRVAYSEALARGLSVDDWNDTAAKDEFRSLVTEIENILGEKRL